MTPRERKIRFERLVELDPLRVPDTCTIEGCERKYYGRGLCKAHYQWHWKRGTLPPERLKDPATQLEMRTIPVPESGCFLWVGPLNSMGYGRMAHSQYAHRAAYELAHGPIPKGMHVCHKCDVPSCVNPDHLFLGTHQENMADSARKGRAKQPAFHGPDHPRAKFTAEDVRYIRTTRRPYAELARQYGVAKNTIYRIRKRQAYDCVKDQA
jgi:hypothetical protein